MRNMGRRVFAGLVAVFFLYVASSLVFPIAMGAVLAVLFWPWLEKLEKKKISTAMGSALLTFGITVVLILTTLILVFFAAKTGFNQLQIWKRSMVAGTGLMDALISMPRVRGLLNWISGRVPLDVVQLADTLQDLAGSVWGKLAEFFGGILTQLPGMIVALAVIVVSVYFFLVDGRRLVYFFRRNTLFSTDQTERLIVTIAETSRSVILASIVSGGAQALIEAMVCMITGTSHIVLIGFLVFVGSFIPIVGSLPITLTVALQQLLEGRQAAGITLLITAVLVMAVDNLIRPWFLRGSANLHPLLAFVAAFGGLQTMGFLGVFLGPILAALFVSTIEMLTHSEELGNSG